jgi:hypothetical protein
MSLLEVIGRAGLRAGHRLHARNPLDETHPVQRCARRAWNIMCVGEACRHACLSGLLRSTRKRDSGEFGGCGVRRPPRWPSSWRAGRAPAALRPRRTPAPRGSRSSRRARCAPAQGRIGGLAPTVSRPVSVRTSCLCWSGTRRGAVRGQQGSSAPPVTLLRSQPGHRAALARGRDRLLAALPRCMDDLATRVLSGSRTPRPRATLARAELEGNAKPRVCRSAQAEL